MDSKLRKTAVITSLAMVLLVGLFVVWLNKKPAEKPQGNKVTTESLSADGADTGPPLMPGQVGTDLSAFERDASFFDPESNPYLEELMDQSSRLSLFVTSVEKDLRIQVRDHNDRVVKGESFFINVEGLGDFKDLDQDGILYVGDIPAGEYQVSLKPIFGYKVPDKPTRIRVKDKVEYVPIADIALLVKTEGEIDALNEDSEKQEAMEDADATEIKELQVSTKTAKTGIDVSSWQGEIDWERVRDAGVEYAILRAGYRGSVTGALVVDSRFEENLRGAMLAQVPVGIYFFTQATNEVEAVEEASMVLALVKNFKIKYPIFLDTEGAGGNGRADGLSVESRTLVCEAFCRTIENAGYRAGVYASKNWLEKNLQVNSLSAYVIWLAEYREVPKYEGYYEMWQYTSKGVIDGIEGNVDLDISYYKMD